MTSLEALFTRTRASELVLIVRQDELAKSSELCL
jgi:hypothetical protein